jgi:outer membrane cobalamin receptor
LNAFTERNRFFFKKKRLILILFSLFLSKPALGVSTTDLSTPDSVIVPARDSLKTVSSDKSGEPVFQLKFRQDSVATFAFKLEETDFQGIIVRHVGDYVKSIPGGSILDLVSTGLPVYSRIRGSATEQSQLTIDGFPINHPQFGPFDLSLLPAAAFHETEISHFNPTLVPASAGSAINFSTPEFELKHPLTTIVWRKGNFGDSEVDVEFGRKISAKTDLIGAVAYNSSDGKYTHSEYDAQKIRFRLTSQIKSNWYLKYQLFHNRSDVDFPIPENLTAETENTYFHRKSSHYIHLLDLRGNVKNDSMEDIRIRSYYSSLYQDFTDHSQLIKDEYRNRFIGIHFQNYLPFKQQLITYGLKTEYRWMRSNQLRNQGYWDGNLFLFSAYSISSKQQIYWSANLELNSGFGIFLAPKLAYALNIASNLKMVINSGISRRLPDFYELYWRYSRIQGNPDLSAERIYHSSANIEWNQEKIQIKGSLYLKKIYDPILLISEKSTPEYATFKNKDSELFTGYEHTFKYLLSSRLTLCSFLDITFKKKLNNSFFINYPQYIKKISIKYSGNFFNNNLQTGISIISTLIGSRWYSIEGTLYPTYYYSENLIYRKWFPLMGIILDGKISNFYIQFAFENILSQNYQSMYGFSAREASIWMNLDWYFKD